MRKCQFITAVLFSLIPVLMEACPMCQGGEGFSKASIYAYKLTTAVLAALPLIMGAGLFWWIRKRVGNQN